jgi:ABC-type proline/glycine betaine transport system permease subunit
LNADRLLTIISNTFEGGNVDMILAGAIFAAHLAVAGGLLAWAPRG